MFMRILLRYGELVKKRPILCQIATSGIMTTTGDIIAQKLENSSKPINFRRMTVMSTIGFCFFGPCLYLWLRFLRRLNMRVLYTVACDQAFAAPFLNSGFIILHPLLSGKSLQETKQIYKSTWWGIMKRGWTIWIPAQTINFSFVPFEFRMLFIQTVALMWNVFLSYQSNASLQKQ